MQDMLHGSKCSSACVWTCEGRMHGPTGLPACWPAGELCCPPAQSPVTLLQELAALSCFMADSLLPIFFALAVF